MEENKENSDKLDEFSFEMFMEGKHKKYKHLSLLQKEIIGKMVEAKIPYTQISKLTKLNLSNNFIKRNFKTN